MKPFYCMVVETTIETERKITQFTLVDYSTGEILCDVGSPFGGVPISYMESKQMCKALESMEEFSPLLLNDTKWNLNTLWGPTNGNHIFPDGLYFIDLQTMAKFLNDSCFLAFGNPFFVSHITGEETISWKEQMEYFFPGRKILTAMDKNKLFFELYGAHIEGFSTLFQRGKK